VQAQRVAERHRSAVDSWAVGRRSNRGQATGCLGHLVERRADLRGDRGGHGPLDERAVHDPDPRRGLGRQQLDRELGRHHGGAEVREHHRSQALGDDLDQRRADRLGVCADTAVRVATNGEDPHVGRHLLGDLGAATRERRGVRDEDQGDVGCAAWPGIAHPTPAADAAARTIRALETAPGSRWPRDRSPR